MHTETELRNRDSSSNSAHRNVQDMKDVLDFLLFFVCFLRRGEGGGFWGSNFYDGHIISDDASDDWTFDV